MRVEVAAWAVRPNEPSGFRGRKAIIIEPCFGIGLSLSLICQPTSEDIKQHNNEGRGEKVEMGSKVSLAQHFYLLGECCFTFTETVGLLGTGAQDAHLDFHTFTPELCFYQ